LFENIDEISYKQLNKNKRFIQIILSHN